MNGTDLLTGKYGILLQIGIKSAEYHNQLNDVLVFIMFDWKMCYFDKILISEFFASECTYMGYEAIIFHS